MSALALRGVSVALDGRPVLRGVDLTLQPGHVLGLLGANGAGKTTLLRVATGVLQPDAGEVRVSGEPIAGFSRQALARKLATVVQDTRVPFPYSVLEIVLMGRTPHLGWLGFESADDVERARAALEELGIAGLAERSVLEVSGGERQLVMVARALAQDAETLLLDEPTASLDLRHRAALLARVRAAAHERGRAALLVSHDLDAVARHCDRIALLAEGRIVAEGSAADVLTAERLRQVYGLDVEIVPTPDGTPVVLPRL